MFAVLEENWCGCVVWLDINVLQTKPFRTVYDDEGKKTLTKMKQNV